MDNNENREVKFSLTATMFNLLFSICAILVLALTKILINFGVASGVFFGIMSIVVYSLAIIGFIWNLFKNSPKSVEFIVSAAILALVLMVF